MDDLTVNMTKPRHAGKDLWHGETACPHAGGTERPPGTGAARGFAATRFRQYLIYKD
jgi:hypothetical protein